jgi:hypothetical protein
MNPKNMIALTGKNISSRTVTKIRSHLKPVNGIFDVGVPGLEPGAGWM